MPRAYRMNLRVDGFESFFFRKTGLQTGQISILRIAVEGRKTETERLLQRHFSFVFFLSVLCAGHDGTEIPTHGNLLLIGR